jgi:tagatose-6-phosphate ketose/aldose isomerase
MLGYTLEKLKENNSFHTANEISGQPELWKDTYKEFSQIKKSLVEFLNKVLAEEDLNIILTGAGTSAFIGETLEGYIKNNFNKYTRSVHSTDIISFPEDHLYKEKPTLLISFARSGNSPESVGVVELANKLCNTVYHLIITCNGKGQLANMGNKSNTFCFVLPPSSNDKSLAMTGSYSAMLLSGILVSKIFGFEPLENKVNLLASIGNHIISTYAEQLKELAEKDFKRGIFLGSGPRLGSAREGHLKLQELTDGKVVCIYDSFLGFRHGPKAVLDKTSLVVYLFSNDEHANKYESDLVKDIHTRQDGLFRMGIGRVGYMKEYLDLLVEMPGSEELDETMLCLCSILPAQMLAFFKSIQVGLNADTPSVSGNISRVVQGVTIYSYNNNHVESL